MFDSMVETLSLSDIGSKKNVGLVQSTFLLVSVRSFKLKFSSSLVILLAAQYFQIMPNFEDFQQLKSWKRQGASAQTKFYKSNKERIFLALLPSTATKLWKSKTNFEHWKFMKSHQSSQYWEIIRKVSIGKQVVTVTNIRQDIFTIIRTSSH